MKTHIEPRFPAFLSALQHQLGMSASLLADGKVLIHRTEFSGERKLRNVQEAIDTFGKYMPEELKQH